MKGEFIEQELFLEAFSATLLQEATIRSSIGIWGRERWRDDCNRDRTGRQYRVEGYGNSQRFRLMKKKGNWVRFKLPNELGPPEDEADLWEMVYSFEVVSFYSCSMLY